MIDCDSRWKLAWPCFRMHWGLFTDPLAQFPQTPCECPRSTGRECLVHHRGQSPGELGVRRRACARTERQPVAARLRGQQTSGGRESRDASCQPQQGFSWECIPTEGVWGLRGQALCRAGSTCPSAAWLWPGQCGVVGVMACPSQRPCQPAESCEHVQNIAGLGEEGAQLGPTGL